MSFWYSNFLKCKEVGKVVIMRDGLVLCIKIAA